MTEYRTALSAEGDEATANAGAGKGDEGGSGPWKLPGLYAARVRAGISGQEVATRSGVRHSAAMSKMERGKMAAGPNRLRALAEALGVPERTLLEPPGDEAPEGVPAGGFRGNLEPGAPGSRYDKASIAPPEDRLLPGLHATRVLSGKSCREVAESAGTDEAAVGRIERGLEAATPEQLRAFAAALDVGEEKLLEERTLEGDGAAPHKGKAEPEAETNADTEVIPGADKDGDDSAGTSIPEGASSETESARGGSSEGSEEGSGEGSEESSAGASMDASRSTKADELLDEVSASRENGDSAPAAETKAPSKDGAYTAPGKGGERGSRTPPPGSGRQPSRRGAIPRPAPIAGQQIPQRARSALDAVVGEGSGMVGRADATRLLEELHAVADRRAYNGGITYQQALAATLKEQILVGQILGPDTRGAELAAFSRDSYSHL